MDRIWIETLKRLDALEERCSRHDDFCFQQRSCKQEPETKTEPPESKPESQKDTVDLPKSEPEQKQV